MTPRRNATVGDADRASEASAEADLQMVEDWPPLKTRFWPISGHEFSRAGWASSLSRSCRPLGWDWRIGCAAIASFPAREVVVATLGVIYNLGEEQDETSPVLRERLQSARWDGTTKSLQPARRAIGDGVFRPLPVCLNARGDSPRNRLVAVAGFHIRLYDGAGIYRGARCLPNRYPSRRVKMASLESISL